MESANRYLQMWLENSDAVTGAPPVMDTVHHEVHEGEMFSAEYVFASVASNGTARYVFVTGAKQPHMTIGVTGGGAMRTYLFEGSTYTGGTAVPSYNMNRLSAKTPTATVYHSPTAGTAGAAALVNGRYIPGGTNPGQGVGAGIRQGVELMMGTSTTYFLDVVNVSGGAVVVGAHFEWYEEPAYAG